MLIFPPVVLEKRYATDVGDAGGNLPPLGLLNMAAILEEHHHQVTIVDAPVENLDLEQILERIASWAPDFIGVSALTFLAEKTKILCHRIRQQNPRIKIFVGGPHPTVMPQQVLDDTQADVVISGEAETIIADLIDHFDQYASKKIINAGKVADLDQLPFPARHLMNLKKYTALPNNYKLTPNSIHVVTSRGCPYPCTFCFDAGTSFRQRSVPHVIRELKELKSKYNVIEIAFWDDTFTFNRAWAMEFCEAMIKEKMRLKWGCITRLNLVDAELLKKMKAAGCWTIFFGIESGNQELLDNIKKRMTVQQMKEKVRLVQSCGIEIRGSFMLGMPGETPAMAEKTIQFAIELDPDYAQFSLTTPYPGTELYKEIPKWGKLIEEYNEFHGWSPVFIPHGYKDAVELKAVHKQAFKRFYLRPKYVLKKVAGIRTLTDIKRYWKGLFFVLGMTRQ